MELGQKVTFDRKLIRKTNRGEGRRYKFWAEAPTKHSSGIFLGFRSLKNGHTDWEEYGWLFSETETIQAALVCCSVRENPIYVPAETLKSQ